MDITNLLVCQYISLGLCKKIRGSLNLNHITFSAEENTSFLCLGARDIYIYWCKRYRKVCNYCMFTISVPANHNEHTLYYDQFALTDTYQL